MPTQKQFLHVASFNGNIGDNASHNGLRETFSAATGWHALWDEREIRHTYLNYDGEDRWAWDADFINTVNDRDLTLIGGGNYFELWVEQSLTGTTVDLDPNLLNRLERPLCFHAVGCDPHKGHSPQTVERFRGFMERLLEHPLCLAAVRNDGSAKYLRKYLGEDIATRVATVPDPGFFVAPDTAEALPDTLRGRRFWAVNLAVDRPELRFPGRGGKLDYAGFIAETAQVIRWATARWPDLEIVLIPHIFSDLTPINDLLNELPDYLRRSRVSVAPYLHGMGSEKTIFALYQQAELALGMRFHANVCPIGLGTPTIGLVSTEKLADLYEELAMPERAVVANEPRLLERLAPLIEATTLDLETIAADYRSLRGRLLKTATAFHNRIEGLVREAG